MKDTASVAADFDEIASALAASPPRHRLTPAERALLAYVPATARTALDVGCGDGLISRTLASRGIQVVGVDVSPRMIALARSRTPATRAIQYRELDVRTTRYLGEFDVVVSIAMVHHLPLEEIVPLLARMVAPGGVLLVQDIVERRGILGFPLNVAGAISRRARDLVLGSRPSRAVTHCYAEHGAGETYLHASDVEQAYAPFVPGARVLQHLEWRYSVIWTRPC